MLACKALELHGHTVTYRTAGSGPVLLLLHGIANSSETCRSGAMIVKCSLSRAATGSQVSDEFGIANSSETWEPVAALLSEHFTIIAPDLLGHGNSATPRGDYSLGAHASGARDLLTALGHDRVTVVGHSL